MFKTTVVNVRENSKSSTFTLRLNQAIELNKLDYILRSPHFLKVAIFTFYHLLHKNTLSPPSNCISTNETPPKVLNRVIVFKKFI